jgi:ABC-type sulfate/molybdate transport systems ATPase subunit
LAVDGIPLLMVTHEMNFARKVADRVAFMHAGGIHGVGKPDELFGAPVTAELQLFLSALHREPVRQLDVPAGSPLASARRQRPRFNARQRVLHMPPPSSRRT